MKSKDDARQQSEAMYEKMLADLAEIKRVSPELSAKDRANLRAQQICKGGRHYYDFAVANIKNED